MSRKRGVLLGVAILIAVAALIVFLMRPVAQVRVVLPNQGGRVADAVLIESGDRLCMRYIHSVERTPVEGWFAVDEKKGFRAVKTKTTGTGTGLPNVARGREVSTEGKWLVIREGGTYYPEIPFYYHPLNKLRIRVGDKRMDLEDVPAGSRLRITSRTKPLWKWIVSGEYFR
jgi:hypothetical protein